MSSRKPHNNKPDLLAACKAILDQKPRVSLTDAECEAERRRWAAMRAAVAKAKGGGA